MEPESVDRSFESGIEENRGFIDAPSGFLRFSKRALIAKLIAALDEEADRYEVW